MSKFFIWLLMGIFLAGCSPKAALVPLPEAVTSASTGPAGLSKVEVSEGVILLTPGQGYQDQSFNGGITNVTGFATPTMMPTVDPASVVMPEGIPLYPGATNLKVPTDEELALMKDMAGLSGYYVIFYTTDSNDQLVQFYSEKAAAAGWSVMDTQTEPDYDGTITQMWGKDKKILLLQTWQPEDGLMKVAVTWN